MPYALSACTEEDAVEFETHILGCESCFEDLKAIDRTRSLIHRFIGASPAALESALLVQRIRRRNSLLTCVGLFLVAFALGILVARLL